MRIESYNEAHRAAWDEFVARHPEASFGHLSGLFALERETAGAVNRSLVVLDERARLVGLLPLYEVEQRTLRLFRTRVLTSGTHFPGGPLFAAALADKQRRALLADLLAQVRTRAAQLGVAQVRIAYPNVVGTQPGVAHFGYLPLRPYGYRETNGVGLLLDLSAPPATLLAGLKSNCRNMIRRAEREGATCELLTDRAAWLACYDLNVQTLGAHCYSRRALELIWDEFVAPGHATVSVVRRGADRASVVVVVGLHASCYYWLGFNPKPALLPGANNLALWQAILLWQQRGARFFELGSLEFDDARQQQIGAFKDSFGGRPHYALGGTLTLKPTRHALLDLLQLGVSRARRHRARPERTPAPPAAAAATNTTADNAPARAPQPAAQRR